MSLFLLENSMGKEVDTNGFWRIKDNPLSKEGVFPYLGKQIDAKLEPNKIYWVYRPMSELSKPETVESFNAVPMIDEHEMIGEGWTPYDDRPAGGVIYNPQAKDGKLYGDIRIFSEKLKEEIESGKKELSMGYECSYEPEHGIFEGKEYDFVQRNLRGNHVALVNRGRMGSDVRVYDHYTFDTLDGLGEFENVAQDREYVRDNIGRFARTNSTSSEEHVTEISGDEFGEFTGDKDKYVKAFRQYYKDNISGKSVQSPILGEVKFFNSSIDETEHWNRATPENLKYIAGVPDLIANSKDVSEEALNHPKKNIICAWRVKGQIKVKDEKPRMVEVIVLEDSQHNRFYTFDARNKKPQAYTAVNGQDERGFELPGGSVTLSEVGLDSCSVVWSRSPESNNSSVNNITQDEYDVNIYLSGGDETMTENDISAMDKEWNESDHPRDEKGQFTDKGGSDSSKASQEYKKYYVENELTDIEAVFGKESDAYKEEIAEIEKRIDESKKYVQAVIEEAKKYNKGDKNKKYLEHIAEETKKVYGENSDYYRKSKLDLDLYNELSKVSAKDDIPSQDGSPKESGVDCSLNQQGEDTLEKEVKDNSEVEDKAKQCKDGCETKKEEVKDDSGVAKKDAEGEAPTEEKKDEGKKEDKKAEDAMIAVADALPEILKSLNEIKASLAQKQSATDSAPITYGLDEGTPAYNNKEDKVLKKYLGEI